MNDNIFSVIGDEFLDHDDVFSCFSIDKLVGVGINLLSLFINRLWHCAGIDYRLFLYDKECGECEMRETEISNKFVFCFGTFITHFHLFSRVEIQQFGLCYLTGSLFLFSPRISSAI